MIQMALYGKSNERYGAFPIINEGTDDARLLMPDGAEVPVEYDPNAKRRHYFFHEWSELDKHLPFDCFIKANRYVKYKDRLLGGDFHRYDAYCNAFDCIVYGWGRKMWADLGIPDADEVWNVAERAASRFMASK
jgi:hypothetical protein